jgi:hypothetical protein
MDEENRVLESKGVAIRANRLYNDLELCQSENVSETLCHSSLVVKKTTSKKQPKIYFPKFENIIGKRFIARPRVKLEI